MVSKAFLMVFGVYSGGPGACYKTVIVSVDARGVRWEATRVNIPFKTKIEIFPG